MGYLFHFSKRRKTVRFSAFFFLAVVVFTSNFSCKEKNAIGSDLLPNELTPGYSVKTMRASGAFSFAEPKIKCDELTSNLLGAYHDPVFGKTEAGIVLNTILSESNPDFGTSPVVDSVFLDLPYGGSYYGNTSKFNALQQLKLYYIDNIIYKDSTYYSNVPPEEFHTANRLILDTQVFLDPTGKFSENKYLHLALPVSFAQQFLDNEASIANNALLQSFFRGLVIKPVSDNLPPGNGLISSISITGTTLPCGITIHYHNQTQSGLKFSLKITGDCTRINYFKHDYSQTTELNQYLNDTLKSGKLFLQYMSGVSCKISLDSLKYIAAENNKIITRADLIIPVSDEGTVAYALPPRLLLVSKNDNGDYISLPDYSISESYFDGNYDPALKAYRFNISVFAQDVLKNSSNFKPLYLVPFGSGISPYRVILKGASDIRLKLTFAEML